MPLVSHFFSPSIDIPDNQMETKMKNITRMTTLAAFLLAGVSGTAMAKGPETAPPEPVRYTPPPPPPARPVPPPPPVVDTCEEGMYISGAAGIGFASVEVNGDDEDLDNGLVLNGAIGYDFGSARLEAAVGYQKHDLSDEDEDVSLLTVMGNAYYDIDTDSDITPYLMAGAGWARAESSVDDDSETAFAWQVGAGLGFQVAECTTLDLGYRYLKPNTFDFDGDDVKASSHNIMLGLRQTF